jgi:hypothetical protein
MVRLVATAVLASLLALAPAAAASKRSEARRYAVAIRAFADAERQAVGAATPAYHARRDAVAAGCIDVVQDGARRQLFAILQLYVFWAAKPLVEAAQPEADRLVRRLGRVTTRSRTLRRARAAHSRRSRTYADVPALLPADLCAELAAWQAAGWRSADEPASSRQLERRRKRVRRRDEPALDRGARFLRRHGVGGRIAAVFEDGSTEVYNSLFEDDPVGQAIEDAVNS